MQFPPGRASIYRLPQVKSADQIPALLREIARERSIIAYTLVLPQYKEVLEQEAAKLKMATIDLLGPLIERMSHMTGQIPLSQPGRLHVLDESYFKRIEAVEFAIRYDDGKNPEGLAQADIILIGVSRTSKTPNCIYLAHHYGLKAANVPLVYGVDPPLALFSASPKKIIGLNLDPYLLQEIRSTRAQILKMSSDSDYADFERIQEEVKNARKLFSELSCHVIDVSGKAIEETSSEIYMHIRL